MSLILKTPIAGPAAWKGIDMADDGAWLHPLSAPELATLDAALSHVKSRGLTFPNFCKDDFPLAGWAHLLRRCSDELENGRGFMVLRGLPVTRYTEEDINILYYGIGLHMGMPVRQNPRG
ncbi:MAG: TauD/TfdA family dioxygenase, partial [Limnohabitans sp.]